jgi:hypothetical protein
MMAAIEHGLPTSRWRLQLRRGVEKGLLRHQGVDLPFRIVFSGPEFASKIDSERFPFDCAFGAQGLQTTTALHSRCGAVTSPLALSNIVDDCVDPAIAADQAAKTRLDGTETVRPREKSSLPVTERVETYR